MKFNRTTFFDGFRVFLSQKGKDLSQTRVDALNFLLESFELMPVWSDVRHIAYALATISIETAWTYQPISEIGGNSYFTKYDGRADLGNNQQGDGARFKGRGFVQITGRRNYTKFSGLLGVDLIKQPTAALEPEISFKIMSIGMHKGLFTGLKLSDFINSKTCDYRTARRIINRLDRADEIAGYAKDFEKILKNSAAVPAVEPSTNNPSTDSAQSADSPAVVDPNSGETLPVKTSANEPQPITQTAENITNVSTGDNQVPDNFVPEQKTVDAPPKENSTATATKLSIAGFAVPTFVIAIIKTIQDLIAQGFVSSADVGNAVIGFISNNQKYIFYLIIAVIGLLIVKKLTKQITLWLKMWINTDPNKHDIEVKPQ